MYPLKGSGAPIDDKFHLFFSLATISCMISVAAARKYDIWITAIGSAIILTATGCISVRDATSAIEIPIMLTICFAFGVGNAISQTKLADAFAKLLVKWLKPVGSKGIHFATYILVGLLTEIITNNGACAVMYPIIAARRVSHRIARHSSARPAPAAPARLDAAKALRAPRAPRAASC